MAMASSDSPSGGDGDRDVFGSLPNTRPQRRSARREPTGAKATPTASRATSSGAAAKAKPAARTKPAARASAATQANSATSAKPAAKAAPPRTTASKSAAQAAPPRASASEIPPAGYATPRGDDGPPHGAELVATAVQAAGELAQIGLAVGGRALKSALGRLPRP
jgi:hypothetical protein